MGAVTAILFGGKYGNLYDAIILDSPFADLSRVISDMAKKSIKMPHLIVESALVLIKS
jgi:hypothetical protein